MQNKVASKCHMRDVAKMRKEELHQAEEMGSGFEAGVEKRKGLQGVHVGRGSREGRASRTGNWGEGCGRADGPSGLSVKGAEGGKDGERHVCLTCLQQVSPSLGKATAPVPHICKGVLLAEPRYPCTQPGPGFSGAQ